MPPDPRLNCAAEICCPAPQAFQARVQILCSLGCSEDDAPSLAKAMIEQEIDFAPASLMAEIAALADHPAAKDESS